MPPYLPTVLVELKATESKRFGWFDMYFTFLLINISRLLPVGVIADFVVPCTLKHFYQIYFIS